MSRLTQYVVGGAALIVGLWALNKYTAFKPGGKKAATAPNTTTGDNAPGAIGQLLNRFVPGNKAGGAAVPTQQQFVAANGQSSPNGTLQTIGGVMVVANQGLGLFNNFHDAFPDAFGGAEDDIDPGALAGNPVQDYQLNNTDIQELAASYSD